MSRSRSLRSLFGEYPVHHGKFNLRQPISANSGSKTLVFTIAVVAYEGPEEVPYHRFPTYLVYYSREMGCDWSGREQVIAARSWRYIFV